MKRDKYEVGLSAIERLLHYTEKGESEDDCWIWIGSKTQRGYGKFSADRKNLYAHRFSYEYFVGPVGDLFVCHSCDNPSCCNPKHLFLGSHSDNMQDMTRKKRGWRQTQTHCKRGHQYSGENIAINSNGGYCCAICKSNHDSAKYYKNKTIPCLFKNPEIRTIK